MKPSALAIIAGVLAAAFAPRAAVTPSAWAAANFIVPDGPRAGQLFDLSLTPYLREPLDFFSDDHPARKGVFRKSKQIGVTTAAMVMCGYTAAVEPADLFLIEPTDSSLAEFNALKLQPAIDASLALSQSFAAQTARSGKGSTTYVKRFRGGSLLMGIATSTADLRGKTRRKVIRDEASEYPADLGGQGSPHEMITGAYETFLASADFKDFWISTPTIKGECAIDREFEAGDRRYWHVACPQCESLFYFDSVSANFKHNDAAPFEPYYVAPCCGYPVKPHERNALVANAERAIGVYRAIVDGVVTREERRAGGWIATAPGPGRHLSWHFDTLSSPFVPWEVYAARAADAKRDPAKRKTFDNLSRGLPHELSVDAPDHMLLMQRREDYRRGHIPPQALLLSIAADVQMRGIYYEALAVAPDGQTWVIDADYLDGATTDHDDGAFAALSQLYLREWPDAFGHRRRADEFGVDSGYRANVVYEWTRHHPGAKALKGEDGWGRPALGVAVDVDVDYGGRRIKGGAKLRAVGTWPLKGVFYYYVNLAAAADGASLIAPPNYCHFGSFLDENYFKQVTAEFLDDVAFRGRMSKRWQVRPHRDNHFLDCRIYNMALIDAYLKSFTADDWAALARERGIPEDLTRPDLFAPRAFAATALKPVDGAREAEVAPSPEPAVAPAPAASWVGRDLSHWLRR